MPAVRQDALAGPLVGLLGEVALLAALAATVGLGPAGWAFGLAYGLALGVLLTRAMDRAGVAVLRPADRVTLLRAVLVGGVTALVADALAGRPVPVVVLMALTITALALDAVDGRVARRTGTASELGARFDMEVDAFLILVLGVYAADLFGWWVLALGSMRYAFVVAGWALPWMRRPLPPRYWRKVVAAAQGIVLTAAVADVLPRPLVAVALAGALALLVESFGRDVLWLWRRQAPRPVLR